MLLIPVELRVSPIHGLGVFTRYAIEEGQLLWEFAAGFDQLISWDVARAWRTAAFRFIQHFAVMRPEHWVLPGDHARFMNHSETPTVKGGRATKDYDAGTELTGDYREYDLDWKRKLGIE